MKVAIDFCLRNEAIEYWNEAKVQDFKLDDDFCPQRTLTVTFENNALS